MTTSDERPSPDVIPDREGRLLALLRETEARMAALEERYRCILDSVEDVVYTMDRHYRFTGLYGRGIARRNIRPDALLGRRLRDFGADPTVAKHERAYEEALSGATVIIEGSPAARPDDERTVRDTLSPLYDAAGAIVGVVGISRDVTAERAADQAREELLVAKARLEGVNLAAREMAHLINNDLTAAVAALELLSLDPALSEERRSMVQHALQGLLNASQHVSQFQQVVRVKTEPLSGGQALDLARSAEAGRE